MSSVDKAVRTAPIIKKKTMMKKTIFCACMAGMLLACSNVEKEAAQKLEAARIAYEQGNYNEAKLQIDSIKILYPKAFEARRAGIKLMQDVELKEQENSLAYLDSLLAEKQLRLDSLKGSFVLEKDTVYQNVGNYLHPSQVIEKNLHRSFLRFQVDERGKMRMTSIYCGATFIHHTAVKVTAPDGSYAETPVSHDSYETTDLGEKIEKADYVLEEDGGVIRFIVANKDHSLRVTYEGDRSFTTRMLPADRQAAAAVYQLAGTLAAITQIQKSREEANLKIAFIKAKKEKQ